MIPRLLLLPFFLIGTLGAADRPNVLFIAIDDMNDWTGFLGGHPQAKTPHMDALAAKGMNFTNAHCPAPACSPCRNALLLGKEPFTTGLYPFYDYRPVYNGPLKDETTLPEHFKKHGYTTIGCGKIHHGSESNAPPAEHDEWSEHKFGRKTPGLKYAPEKGYQQGSSHKMAFCPTTNELADHKDYDTAQYGIKMIGRKHDAPFFLALGFIKPHLAFVCPEKYFDLHSGPIAPPRIKPDDLADLPWVARSNAKLGDDMNYQQDGRWEKVRRSYLACISWTDSNIGLVLDALAKSPHADNTIVVLWSDHGYHLGEKRSFRKFTLWEEATRVPFILHDPRIKAAAQSCPEAVSLIDIFPTLCELTGVPAPDDLDGESLVPWLKDPTIAKKSPAITTWGRGNYSIRTRNWRYNRYFDGSEELYDHKNDPDEWDNLAETPEMAGKKKHLASFLPKDEAPLILEAKALHNVVDADQPSLDAFKKQWKRAKAKLNPPIE